MEVFWALLKRASEARDKTFWRNMVKEYGVEVMCWAC
jgi:hypothetical protein